MNFREERGSISLEPLADILYHPMQGHLKIFALVVCTTSLYEYVWAFAPPIHPISSSNRKVLAQSSAHQKHHKTSISLSLHRTPTDQAHVQRYVRDNTILFSSVSSSDEEFTSSMSINKVDQILSKLTSLFPLFVLCSAILGSYIPQTLNWVNNGNLISIMLAGVMLGTGMTLERSDFTDIITDKIQRTSIPIGVLCQVSHKQYFRVLRIHEISPLGYISLTLCFATAYTFT